MDTPSITRNIVRSNQAITELLSSIHRTETASINWQGWHGTPQPVYIALKRLKDQLSSLEALVRQRWKNPLDYSVDGPPSIPNTSLETLERCCSDLNRIHQKLNVPPPSSSRTLFSFGKSKRLPSEKVIGEYTRKITEHVRLLKTANPTIDRHSALPQATKAEEAYQVYVSTNNMSALDDAVKKMRIAVTDAPKDHRDRGAMLNNLAVWTAKQATATEPPDMEKFQEACRLLLSAVKTTQMSDPQWCTYRYNLRDHFFFWSTNSAVDQTMRTRTGPCGRSASSMYEPLLPDSLRLLKPIKGDSLRFTLKQYVFSEAPGYIALSYTWSVDDYCFDSGETQRKIKVDGYDFDVHENLFDALEHVWADVLKEDKLLWVDSVCINQADKEDIDAQVPLMGKIFDSSEVVFAWLGLPLFKQEIEFAIALIHSFEDETEKHRRSHGGSLSGVEVRRLNMDANTLFPKEERPGTVAAWEGLAHLFSRALWRRTWTRQELTTRRPTLCYCGEFVFSLDEVWSMVNRATAHEEHPNFHSKLSMALSSGSHIENILLMRNRRQTLDRVEAWPLIEVMRMIRPTRCTNPRDKVYAPMGLATDAADAAIANDSKIDIAVLYTQVACWALQQEYALSFLGLVYYSEPDPDDEPTLPGLPSWVPDWRYKSAIPLGPLKSMKLPKRETYIYNPCRGKTGEYFVSGKELHVEGLLFDKIHAVTSSLTPLTRDADSWKKLFLSDWKPDLKAKGAVFTDSAFSRTVVADTRFDFHENEWHEHRGGMFDFALLDLTLSRTDKVQWGRRSEHLQAVRSLCLYREAGYTTGGRLCLLPESAKIGDCIVALLGGPCLYVIRPCSESGQYTFIGECYVDEMMDGQVIDLAEEIGLAVEKIFLV